MTERKTILVVAMKLKEAYFPRPMTYDLIRNIQGVFNAEVLRSEMTDLRGNTYYALIHISLQGKEITIDSRPSDAIAAAVGAGAPIYVTEEVLLKTKAIQLDKDLEKDEFKEFLENLNPEDFEYKT